MNHNLGEPLDKPQSKASVTVLRRKQFWTGHRQVTSFGVKVIHMLYYIDTHSAYHNCIDCTTVLIIAHIWILYASDVLVISTIRHTGLIAGSDINTTRAVLGVATLYATTARAVWSAQRQRTQCNQMSMC